MQVGGGKSVPFFSQWESRELTNEVLTEGQRLR